MTRWKNFRFHLEKLGCLFLAWMIPCLSRKASLRLSSFLGSVAFHLDQRGRKVGLSNLECAFGEKFTPVERNKILLGSYRNFVRTMLDLFWAQQISKETFSDWIQVEGFDRLLGELGQGGRGSIMMCVHQGNWEWASLAFGFLGLPTTIVAENFKNPHLTAIFERLREHSGHTIIAQENSILRLLKISRRGGATGMLIDLSLPPTQAATAIEALGMQMCVPILHAVLAERVNALLIPIETQPREDGTCRVIAHPVLQIPPGANVHEIAQLCWDRFEPIIRERPETYLWPYKHFRYRPTGTTREYPVYANESGKFEKVLKSKKTRSTGK